MLTLRVSRYTTFQLNIYDPAKVREWEILLHIIFFYYLWYLHSDPHPPTQTPEKKNKKGNSFSPFTPRLFETHNSWLGNRALSQDYPSLDSWQLDAHEDKQFNSLINKHLSNFTRNKEILDDNKALFSYLVIQVLKHCAWFIHYRTFYP